MYDIVIIGAGPAGLTAAIYARRAEKTVLVIEKSTFGGQMTYSPKIENFPAFSQISGLELSDKMVEHALSLGTEIEADEVIDVKIAGDVKQVVCTAAEYETRALIIATGVEHRHLGLAKETDFCGHGVSYCAVCDGAFYKDKVVGVVGGGNSALQEAILLSEIAKKVYVIQNLNNFTGEKKLVETLKKKSNVEFIMGTTVTELLGDTELRAIKVESNCGHSDKLDLDGLFVAIGLAPKNKIFSNVASLDENGYFDTDESCVSTANGVFVAGDCRRKNIRQITTAVSDGSVAALAAYRYLETV